MANYPAQLPAAKTRSDSDMSADETHTTWHDTDEGEIIAIATELGTTPSGPYSTVKARLDAIDNQVSLASSTVWTPSWTNLSVGNGTVVARYTRVGPLVVFYAYLMFGSTTSITGSVAVTLPVAAFNPANQQVHVGAKFVDSSLSATYAGAAALNTSTTVFVRMFEDASASATNGIIERAITASAPFTWANQDVLQISGSYLAA